MKNRKRVLSLIVLLAALIVGCGGQAEQGIAPPVNTAAPTANPTQMEVETFSITTPEPVVTQSEVMLAEQPSDFAPPPFYSSLTVDGRTIYTFLDSTGTVQYRAYGCYYIYHNDEVFETVGAIYPVSLNFEGESAVVSLVADAAPIDPQTEPLGSCTAMDLPEGTRVSKTYSRQEQTGLYWDGEQYLIYGSFPNAEPTFYPATSDGKMIAGALPYEGEVIIPSYYPEDEPKADGSYLLVVYINTQSVVAYHAEDGQWVQKRVMICSTGRSDKYYPTPRGNFKIPENYRYKKLGMKVGDYWYGQYASRITTNYLFHSTPIWEEAGRDVDLGKTMVKLSQYEMLGQPASGGCVRLTVIDAKWIYDNCPIRTEVRIGDWDGPIAQKPPALIYEEPYMTGEDMGWDPTDPDPLNPYHAVYGVLD